MNEKIKYFFILLAASCISNSALCQNTDTAFTVVHYSFSHITDTNYRDRPYTEEMVLYIGKQLSVFKSYDKIVADSLLKASYFQSSTTGTIDTRNRKRTSNVELFKNNSTNVMTIQQKLMGTYLIEDPIPPIQWQVKSETKTISGIICQKAIGKFGGRVYEAWFAPQFNYNNGPWKLGGLPGLIMEASDTKREVIFAFNGMQQSKQTNVLINLPKEGTKVNNAAFQKIKDAYRKDPVGFVNSAPPVNGITVRVENAPRISPQKPINNPLELPDNL